MKQIKNILKKLLYIPLSILFIINLILMGIIGLFNFINKHVFVNINNYIADYGDYLDSIIKNEVYVKQLNPNQDNINQLLQDIIEQTKK